uniref:Uncharacterized protein n=1 Tax=Arundo donax TaxID=35708 RepID=A0A0A9FW63_ARUDO
MKRNCNMFTLNILLLLYISYAGVL